MTASLSDAKQALVRQRALEGVVMVLSSGRPLTFSNAAEAAGISERTFYRQFPTRAALLAGVLEWANRRIGFEGERPTSLASWKALVHRTFPGFDTIAPVIHELLVSPEGRTARLADNAARRRAALALVRKEAAGLDTESSRRLAAVVQLLTAAGTWQTLREYWELDGAESARTVTYAIELLLEGARARVQAERSRQRRRSAAKEA